MKVNAGNVSRLYSLIYRILEISLFEISRVKYTSMLNGDNMV